MARAGRAVLLDSELKREDAHESHGRVGSWPRARLEAMDQRLRERVARAIERGQEQRQSDEAARRDPTRADASCR